jgi:hypothetical protein
LQDCKAGRPFFLKKAAENFCSIGFGLSAEAQPDSVKVFWFFFSKKNRFPCRLPFRGGDLHTWAVTKKTQKTLANLASAFPARLRMHITFCCFPSGSCGGFQLHPA